MSNRIFPLSAQSAYLIVLNAAKRAGLGIVRPHDLRRTYSKLSREGGAPIEQIQETLGHASIQTTQRYLGTMLELRPGLGCGDYIQFMPTREDEDKEESDIEMARRIR